MPRSGQDRGKRRGWPGRSAASRPARPLTRARSASRRRAGSTAARPCPRTEARRPPRQSPGRGDRGALSLATPSRSSRPSRSRAGPRNESLPASDRAHASMPSAPRAARAEAAASRAGAGPHQVGPGILARADKIARLLFELLRHPHRCQLSQPQQPRQPLGVTTVGLDPLRRRARDLARRRNQTLDPRPRTHARELEAGRPAS